MKKFLFLGLMLLGASSLFAAGMQQNYGTTQTIPTADASYLDFDQAYIYYNSGDGKKIYESGDANTNNMVQGSYIIFKLENTTEKDFLLSFKGAQGKSYNGILGVEVYSTDPIADGSTSPFFNKEVTITITNWSTYNDYTVYVPSVPSGTLYMKLIANNSFAGNFKEFAMTEFNNSLNTTNLTFDIQNYFTTSGTITINDGEIGSTKNNASVTYMFTVPETGKYGIVANWSSKNNTTLSMNVSDSSSSFDAAAVSIDLTSTGAWDAFIYNDWGTRELTAGTVYYLQVKYTTEAGWAGNTNYIALKKVWYNVTDDNSNLQENEIYQDGANYTAKSIVLNDDIDYYLPFDVQATTASYTRTVTANSWNALYLPFAVANASDFAESMIKFKEVEKVDEQVNLVFEAVDVNSTLEADKIYLFQPKAAGSITATGTSTTVNSYLAGTESVAVSYGGSTYTLTGTYAKTTDLQSMSAYALSGDGFHKASSNDVVLNPYRAYLTITASGKAPASVGIKTVEGTNSLSAINNANSIENDVYYNLQGMRVDNPTQGLYIHNGKKIYVK